MATELRFDPIAEARRLWGERWGENVTPSMSAVTSIMRAQQILLARLNAILGDFDLTFARYEALMLLFLSSRGSLPLGKIGDRLQVHRTSVTNLIDGLERSGYVRRLAHESDRRTTLAEITSEGRTVAERATAQLNEARFGTDSLEADELETIYALLRGFREHADEIDS
jgi:DNA-binding MarR family transcriptional regulator